MLLLFPPSTPEQMQWPQCWLGSWVLKLDLHTSLILPRGANIRLCNGAAGPKEKKGKVKVCCHLAVPNNRVQQTAIVAASLQKTSITRSHQRKRRVPIESGTARQRELACLSAAPTNEDSPAASRRLRAGGKSFLGRMLTKKAKR